ncbi:MAG: aminotransferase, partial [Bacteroidales bacterium]
MQKEIKPADRLEGMSEYYFSSKLREVAMLNAQEKNIISLAIGSPDLMPQDGVIETLCEEARQKTAHGYQPNIGR